MRRRSSVILIKNGEVLLFHRWRNGVEYYAIPGGGIEGAETPEEAALREMKEETNLDIAIQRNLGVQIVDIDKTHPEMGQFENNMFLSTAFTGNVAIGEQEIQKTSKDNIYILEWVPIAKLETISLRPDEKEIIQKTLPTL